MLHALYLVSSLCLQPLAERPAICVCGGYQRSLDQQAAFLRHSVDRADAVFIGMVISAIDTMRRLGSSDYPVRRAILVIETVWKGQTSGTTTVLTGTACPIPFTVGERYLVFAEADSNGVFLTRGCSYTGLLASMTKYLPALGEPLVASPLPDSVSPPR
jgi:hypothetical protein